MGVVTGVRAGVAAAGVGSWVATAGFVGADGWVAPGVCGADGAGLPVRGADVAGADGAMVSWLDGAATVA